MKLKQIHKDFRGTIDIINGLDKYPEVTVFKTKAEHARGGCIHKDNEEFVCVIEGIIEYYSGEERRRLFPGDSFHIPKNTPHYFISMTDSTVLEWGATEEEKQEKHDKFRRIVDEINSRKLASSML